MLKLMLKDGTEIELEEVGYTQHYVVVCEDIRSFQEILDNLTEENLSEIRIAEDGNIVHTIISSSLEGTQTVTNSDGTITGHFYLCGGEYRQPSDEYSEAGKILLGEEV